MKTAVLHAMPMEERMQLIDQIWDSVMEDADPAQLAPAWHADVLAERLKAFEEGTEITMDLDEAIERIREQLIRG